MARAYVYDMVDTWNAGATTFTAIKMNVTDTASAAASLLMDLQVGGSSKFSVRKDGATTIATKLAGGGFTLGENGSGAITVRATGIYGWSNDTTGGGAYDLILARDAADTLAQRNGVNAQTFRVYNTYTDASNYERVNLSFAAGTATLETAALGTGAARTFRLLASGNLELGGGGGSVWRIPTTGHLLALTDNTFDIGASGANRPRNIYLGSGVYTPYLNTTSSAGAVRAFWYSAVANVMSLGNSTGVGGSLELTEDTAPAAPSTNSVRIYAEDNGAGKTRIMARFATGAAVQIAIEP